MRCAPASTNCANRPQLKPLRPLPASLPWICGLLGLILLAILSIILYQHSQDPFNPSILLRFTAACIFLFGVSGLIFAIAFGMYQLECSDRQEKLQIIYRKQRRQRRRRRNWQRQLRRLVASSRSNDG